MGCIRHNWKGAICRGNYSPGCCSGQSHLWIPPPCLVLWNPRQTSFSNPRQRLLVSAFPGLRGHGPSSVDLLHRHQQNSSGGSHTPSVSCSNSGGFLLSLFLERALNRVQVALPVFIFCWLLPGGWRIQSPTPATEPCGNIVGSGLGSLLCFICVTWRKGNASLLPLDRALLRPFVLSHPLVHLLSSLSLPGSRIYLVPMDRAFVHSIPGYRCSFWPLFYGDKLYPFNPCFDHGHLRTYLGRLHCLSLSW